jgi:hypothetical protein
VSNNPEEDTNALYNKIDNLEYQIHVKDTGIKFTTERNKGLR